MGGCITRPLLQSRVLVFSKKIVTGFRILNVGRGRYPGPTGFHEETGLNCKNCDKKLTSIVRVSGCCCELRFLIPNSVHQ